MLAGRAGVGVCSANTNKNKSVNSGKHLCNVWMPGVIKSSDILISCCKINDPRTMYAKEINVKVKFKSDPHLFDAAVSK